MRLFNEKFEEANQRNSRGQRVVIEIDFSEDETDLHYFPSHADTVFSNGEVVTQGVLTNWSGNTQKMNFERSNSSTGTLDFSLLDVNQVITNLFYNKRVSNKVLYGKRVRLYRGYEGLGFDDFEPIMTQYISENVKHRKPNYLLSCRDAQDRLNKEIFVPLETRLSLPLSIGGATIQVYNNDDWQMIERDSDFKDAPNTTCTYLKIYDDKNFEVCRVTAIDTALKIFNVDRGVLGTTEQDWALPNDPNEDKGPKVQEFIFYEMNSLKFAYAIATGKLLGQGAATIPSHHQLGIPDSVFDVNDFTDPDVFLAEGRGLTKTNAKKFIESEIFFYIGRVFKVDGFGNVKIKKVESVHKEVDSVRVIKKEDIVKTGDLVFDNSSMFNVFSLNWSYDVLLKKPIHRRTTNFKYSDSVDFYKRENLKTVKSRLINGSSSTTNTLLNAVNLFADRYAGEAARLPVTLQPWLSGLELGDVITIEDDRIYDLDTGQTLNRSMQIQSVRISKNEGLSVELFGSTFKPNPISDSDIRSLADSFYNSQGSVIPNIDGGTLSIPTTLVGSADMNAPASIYYYLGNLSLAAPLTIQGNVQLRIRGFLTGTNFIDCAGNGAALQSGMLGTTQGAPGINYYEESFGWREEYAPAVVWEGEYSAAPLLNITNDDGSSLQGIPTDFRGTGGGPGGDTQVFPEVTSPEFLPGESAVPGGAGLLVICRGASLTGSANINMSGAPINQGSDFPLPEVGLIARTADSAHGAPGACIFLLDGGTSVIPNFVGRVIAQGDGSDIQENACRAMFIPPPRIPIADEYIDESDGGSPVENYTWIKYGYDTSGSGISDNPTGKTHIGLSFNNTTQTESNNPADYQWSQIQGDQGVPGTPGSNGETLYTWIKYADDAVGTGISDNPSGKAYFGISYNNTVQGESNNPADYAWSKIEGDQGVPGPPGADGQDGQTLYTWIKYGDNSSGSGISDSPTGKTYIGVSYNNITASESNNPADYAWSLIQGDQGVPGVPGADGSTLYTWIKYADDASGTGITDNPAGKAYFGISYNNASQTESNNPADYSWSKIEGDQGVPGPPGADGQDGQTLYTWIKYGDNASGAGLTDSPTGKTYIGVSYNNASATESTNPADYSWSLIQGDQGVPGTPGADGSTLYTWIKYGDDASGSGISDNPAGKAYIGISYNNASQTESNNPADYAWSKVEGDQGVQGPPGTPGTQGPPGADGAPTYIWIKYADTAAGAGLTDNPTGKAYIGIAYNQSTQTESTNPADYDWQLVQGDQGIPGPPGADGQPNYTWVKYADSDTGAGISDSPTGKTYIGLAFNRTTSTESNSPGDYTWFKIVGDDGLGANPILNSTNDPLTGLTHVSVGNGIIIKVAYNREIPGTNVPGAQSVLNLRRDGVVISSWTMVRTQEQEPGFEFWTIQANGETLDTPGTGSTSYDITIDNGGSSWSSDDGYINTREEQ